MARLTGMSAWALALVACALCTADAAVTGAQTGSAVQKVIQMLTDMAGKAKIEKNEEETAFAKFATWCAQESANLKGEISKNGEEIELLSTSIDKLTDDIKCLGEAISGLQTSVAKHTADKTSQDAQRAKDHAAFQEEQQDYSESVDALERAIAMLEKENYDRPGSSALLQIQADQKLPAKARSIITALLGMITTDNGPDYSAPEANGYEFQSTGIVDMLKKLNDEFRDKLATCQKEEMNSKHAYDMIVSDLTDSIENAEKDTSEKTTEKDSKAEQVGLDKKQLSASLDVKAANEKMLSDMTAECNEKRMSFDEKQQLRAEEIQAIEKAIEIMASPDVSANAEKHLALAQAGKAKSLVQHLRSGNVQTQESDMSPRRKVRTFLEQEGARLKSKDLALLAQKLAADPFSKVKKMIDDMITRLMEEAKNDADHEGFCDTELGKNKITRNKLSEDIDMLNAAVENGKSTVIMLADSSATLAHEVADLDQAVSEATVLRGGEKLRNAGTVKDSQAAQTAIAAATAVLKDFYEKAATATGFLQISQNKEANPVKMGSEEWKSLATPAEGTVDKGHKAGMQTFGEAYKGNQDANNGVLALLEVLASDFATLEADTSAEEAASQEAYERFMVESKKSKAVKDRKITMNDSDRASAESKLREDIADLKATQDELLAADRYYSKLVPQCLDQGMTWDERVGARAAEVASLKEALKILESNGSVA